MVTATIQEAQTHLSSLIAQLKPGEELVIIERNRPVRVWWQSAARSPVRGSPASRSAN